MIFLKHRQAHVRKSTVNASTAAGGQPHYRWYQSTSGKLFLCAVVHGAVLIMACLLIARLLMHG